MCVCVCVNERVGYTLATVCVCACENVCVCCKCACDNMCVCERERIPEREQGFPQVNVFLTGVEESLNIKRLFTLDPGTFHSNRTEVESDWFCCCFVYAIYTSRADPISNILHPPKCSGIPTVDGSCLRDSQDHATLHASRHERECLVKKICIYLVSEGRFYHNMMTRLCVQTFSICDLLVFQFIS